jgi:uncharacterized membrane protein (DUF4010 family)
MYAMDTVELFERLSIALAIGLLIGLERGWQTREDLEGERAAGLRTHALAALLGAVWGAIVHPLGAVGGVALSIAFIVFGAATILFRYREAEHDATFGATTMIATLLAFALGAFAVLGDMRAAAAAGVAATGLLSLKAVLHAWVRRLTWAELRSGLVLLVMAFILPPLLPNREIDPWKAINPYEIWLMTVLIGVISFAGYVAVQLVGDRRGVAVAGMAGGLASSTAATAAMARLAREQPGRDGLLAAGALFANAVMAPRILAIVAVIDSAMTWRLAPALGAAGFVFAVAGAVLMWRGEEPPNGERRLVLDNPLDFGMVMKFGALLSTVMILSKVSTNFAGSAGAYALAALSGVADVDAIALTMVRHGAAEIGIDAASRAILLAAAVNTVSKAAMGWLMGGAGFGWRISLASALAVAAGWAGLLFVPAL